MYSVFDDANMNSNKCNNNSTLVRCACIHALINICMRRGSEVVMFMCMMFTIVQTREQVHILATSSEGQMYVV